MTDPIQVRISTSGSCVDMNGDTIQAHVLACEPHASMHAEIAQAHAVVENLSSVWMTVQMVDAAGVAIEETTVMLQNTPTRINLSPANPGPQGPPGPPGIGVRELYVQQTQPVAADTPYQWWETFSNGTLKTLWIVT